MIKLIKVIALLLIAATPGHPWTPSATAQSAPACKGLTGSVKQFCESDALRSLHKALEKLSAGREGDEAVKAAMKRVQGCRSPNDDCVERALIGAIVALAKKSGDAKGYSGWYIYRRGTAGGGSLWVARMPDGRLAGGIATVTGPSAHTCGLDFEGAELKGAAFEWVDPDPEVKGCLLKLVPQSGAFKVETTPRCYEHYCGLRGRMDFTYKRE